MYKSNMQTNKKDYIWLKFDRSSKFFYKTYTPKILNYTPLICIT